VHGTEKNSEGGGARERLKTREGTISILRQVTKLEINRRRGGAKEGQVWEKDLDFCVVARRTARGGRQVEKTGKSNKLKCLD